MKPRIAIHNLHELPNLFHIGIHNYVLNLLSNGDVRILYFDLGTRYISKDFILKLYSYFRSIETIKSWNIPWSNINFIFSVEELNINCDVLLNFNSHLGESQFPKKLNKFNGIKIYHVNDYFWNRPASDLNKLLVNSGVNFVMGYSNHDKYCSYFQKFFPSYLGKVISVPFGYSNRFVNRDDFFERINKCVALGSVNPLRPIDSEEFNYIESANFFKHEVWFHKFRRIIVENRERLDSQIDSLLPIYPDYKDFKYDIVEKFNQYRMFVSCESIFNFPPAKYFEGPACGTVLVCSDHECNKDLGFIDGVNSVMYKKNNLNDLSDKINYYKNQPEILKQIQDNGTSLVQNNYSHKDIAKSLVINIGLISQ